MSSYLTQYMSFVYLSMIFEYKFLTHASLLRWVIYNTGEFDWNISIVAEIAFMISIECQLHLNISQDAVCHIC